jgi:GTP cyclohydrolase I
MNVVAAKKPTVSPIEDVQGRADTRRIPINKVGIKDIFHPVKVKDRARGEPAAQFQGHAHVALRRNPASRA